MKLYRKVSRSFGRSALAGDAIRQVVLAALSLDHMLDSQVNKRLMVSRTYKHIYIYIHMCIRMRSSRLLIQTCTATGTVALRTVAKSAAM